MTPECLQCFQEVCNSIFVRWEALKLAVEHMGGRHGHQTAIDIKTYVFNFCTQNEGVGEIEISDLLNELMDEEFDTICEDNSVDEISKHLIRFLKSCANGQLDGVRQELAQLPPCTNWLEPGYVMNIVRQNDDSDSESDSDEDDDVDMEDDDASQLVDGSTNNVNSPTAPSNRRNQTDEDGWTTIPARRRQR